MNSPALADRIGAIAAGTLAAQRFVEALRTEQVRPDAALEELRQVQIAHGVGSAAVGAWLTELAKRIR